MKFSAFALLAILALASIPTTNANAACNNFVQSRTIAGNTVTVQTSSCFDSYVDPCMCYSYAYWSNVTLVQVSGPNGQAFAVDNSYWQSSDYTGYHYEFRQHNYNAGVFDPAYNGASLGAGDYQQTSNSSPCYENAYASQYEQLPATGSGLGGSLGQNMGGSNPLPCTDRTTQETLP